MTPRPMTPRPVTPGPEALAPLSVVIPVRNEAAGLASLLADLATAPQLVREVLVIDGGSHDPSPTVARLAGARVRWLPPGRGRQLAAGVAASDGPWLLLLHGDGRLPVGWARAIGSKLHDPTPRRRPEAWYFNLAIAAPGPALRLVERAVALRCRWRQLPYGDQGLLLSRRLLEHCGGIAPLPLMEDLDLVLRLRRQAQLRSLGLPLTVDGRRWRRLGVWQTTLANAQLRRQWRRGVPVEELAVLYGQGTP